jgi:hypothetical protein
MADGQQHVTAPSSGARADEAPPRPSPQTSPVLSTLPPGPAVSPPLPAILLAPVCYHRPPWSPQVFPPGRPRPPDPQRRLRHSVQRYGSLPPRPRQAQSQFPPQSQLQTHSVIAPTQWRAVPHSAHWPSPPSACAHIPLQARSPAGFRPNAAMTEVSSTRLYLGNLPRNATKAEVEGHFQTHGTGEITEIKLMNGFGFIEYKDAMDARDVVPAFRKCPSLPLRVLLPRLTLSRWLRLHGRASHCPVRSRFAPQ